MRPIIALFGEVDDELCITMQNTYVKAIEGAGGIPLIVPCVMGDGAVDDIIARCDGFLFTGGDDIHPSRYGETVKEKCGSIQLFRDELEFRVLDRILLSGKPIVAVCRGIQLLNVFFGGTLYQDIPTELDTPIAHKQNEPKFSVSHRVRIVADTPLYELLGAEYAQTNSFHHQAIKELGRGLSVMALADDGIIEGVYAEGEQYIRAYQWHPERIFETDGDNRKIFEDFIDACKIKA